MSTYKNSYINKNKYTRPGSKLVGVRAILIHWTANPGASAANHKTYFGNGAGGRYASAHIFVDEKETLCIIPLNEVAYAANETGYSKIAKLRGNFGYTNGNANGCTISVEMCVEKNGTISTTVEAKTVKIVAELCKKYGLTEKDVYRHYDVTGKSCPTPFIGNERFAKFKDKVKSELNGKAIVVPVSKPIATKAEYFISIPNSKSIQCITNVGIFSSVNFSVETKLKDHFEPGDTVPILAVENSKNGTPRFKIKGGYISANKAYVKEYTAIKNEKVIGTIITLAPDLNYYDSPRWNKPEGTVKKGTKLTVIDKILVDGAYQYKLISGNYITASDKYVKFTAK